MSGADVCAILALHGFTQVRRKGSHISMRLALSHDSRTVVVPDHDEVAMGTLASIIRQSGLDRALFER